MIVLKGPDRKVSCIIVESHFEVPRSMREHKIKAMTIVVTNGTIVIISESRNQ